MYKFAVQLLCLIFISCFCVAQTPSNIKSVLLKPLNKQQNVIAAPLGTTLQLSFDDLEADQKTYYYTIQHMSFDWQPSSIASSQYIEGFQSNDIQNIENSFNTLQNYSHYSVNFPNVNTRIKISGNYLISVLDEYEDTVFSRRITLYEPLTTVGVNVIRSRDAKYMDQKQTVQFSVFQNELQVNNPAQEIKVVVLQNNNWQTAITNLQPQFYRNNQLIYRYTNKSNFWAGNEFLNFDNKYIRDRNITIQKVERKDIFNTYLYTQDPRNELPYTYNPDINGQFVIRSLEANNNDTEADYANIHFSLATEEPYTDKSVYVYGGFNNFELTPQNEMTYNTSSKKYEVSILLKQGFYNYSFVTKNTNEAVNLHEIDGSHYQTENLYSVLVYYKAFGALYTRVIGFGSGTFSKL